MKVILRQPLENLGNMGEIVSVRDGYARNYLIPRSLAYLATADSIKRLEVEKKQFVKKQAIEKGNAEKIAVKFADLQVTIAMRVGEEGRLFGSVTPQAIGKELSLLGYEIDRRHIIIDEPIKTLGVFSVKIKLHTDVVCQLKVWVIGEE